MSGATAPDESTIPSLKPFWQNKYKSTATRNWNNFYKRNTTNFFKDRHWLDAEFPSLLSTPNTTGLEVGCGVGNLVYPALERNDSLKLYACDFSETAVSFVKSHTAHDELCAAGRIEAFVADITVENPFPSISPDSLDFITCVFVLSAIPPTLHKQVFEKFRRVMKPGAVICFRDYAAGDLAQIRFQRATEVPKIEDYLYVRQDGTMSYFFRTEYFKSLIEDLGCFEIESIDVVERRTKNIKRGLDEARYFLQAVIRKK